MLLADSAQVSEGKLFVLGGGWSRIGPGPTPSAVAIIIEVPWDQTNVTHRWRLELVDSDGRPVMWTPTPGSGSVWNQALCSQFARFWSRVRRTGPARPGAGPEGELAESTMRTNAFAVRGQSPRARPPAGPYFGAITFPGASKMSRL